MRSLDTTEQRDDAIDERLGTATPALRQLEDALYDDYSSDGWGLRRFAALQDEEQRAVASDLVISAVEGVQVNLREMALCDLDLQDLIGPNGRCMPGPDTTIDELLDAKRLHRAITDFARAFGSTLDCLAATTIGVLGLPSSIQQASGGNLITLPEFRDAVPRHQDAYRKRVESVLNEHRAAEPAGWLEWTLELRNAVVHRGHLTQVYLPRRRRQGPQIAVATSTPPQYLVRMEPHLRAQPWLPDMLSLSTPGPAEAAIWLAEPAHHTTANLKARLIALIEGLASELAATVQTDASGWNFPASNWALTRTSRRARTTAAAQFHGFDRSYPVPPTSQIRAHPRSAGRLELAKQLRARLGTDLPTAD